MSNIDALFEDIRKQISELLFPLQVTKEVDQLVFQALMVNLNELAVHLKPIKLLPKALLNEIYRSSRILRADAQYLKSGGADAVMMAEQIETLFSLILLGESREDRVPGVPRVV